MSFITRNENGLIVYGVGYTLHPFGVLDPRGEQIDASITKENATFHDIELPEGVLPFTAAYIDGDFVPVEVEPPVASITPEEVDAERDRRVTAGFIFDGKLYQTRNEDRENIAGAALAALAAQIGGAEPGDYRWHGGDSDFVWIAEDNSLTPMDAQTMLAFGQAAMAHKQAHIFAARALKDSDPSPLNIANDGYWP